MSKEEDRQDAPTPPQTAAEGSEPQELSPESVDGVVGGLMTAGLSAAISPRSAIPPVCISQS